MKRRRHPSVFSLLLVLLLSLSPTPTPRRLERFVARGESSGENEEKKTLRRKVLDVDARETMMPFSANDDIGRSGYEKLRRARRE